MKKILITKRLTALVWTLVLALMPMSLMADNTPLSVTVTSEGGSFANEQAGNAFDGITTNKWCGGKLALSGANAYVQVRLAEKSKLDYYYLYTGNDINYENSDGKQQRNPKEWKLYAKVNEGDEWTLISHVTDAGLPTTVSTRSNNYKIDAAYQNIEYNYLKFKILQIEKGDIFEVGEICFIKCNHTFGSDDICTECGYKKQQDDGFINVATTIQLWNAINANDHAKVRLTADFALSDINKDGELYCNGNTFYGTIDGNGHTIKGDPVADVRARTYMFSMTDGATIKNLTFKGIRVNSDDYSNQAIITSKAQNGCVFENITFDNVHTFSNLDNAGSVAGWADHCTFKDITVKNSDFTVDDNQAGCVVGHAISCTFSNIKVENCECTSADDFGSGGKSGGVAGRTDGGTIDNVEILGCFIQTYSEYAGGVVGYSSYTKIANCIVDDQSCVFVDGDLATAEAGGIVGRCLHCNINNCINSALIAVAQHIAGGIVGTNFCSTIEGCLNTGMVIAMSEDKLKHYYFYDHYKNQTGITCVTKTYQGKEYVIRKYPDGLPEILPEMKMIGGIAGVIENAGEVSKCVNLGSVYSYNKDGGIGGIAGRIETGTISDCLCDFFCKDAFGICQLGKGFDTGVKETSATVNNCLNMTAYKDFSAEGNKWGDFKGEHNYSLTTAENAEYTNKTTAAKIKSGEICLKLGENWEQNIGTDAYPTPTGNRGIYHMRYVKLKEYGTICVPFPLETLKGVGVDKREYYLFNEVKNEADGTISICFKYTDVVPAGTPAIFSAYVTSDYYFVPMEKEYQFEVQPTVGTEWTFNGTFEQKVFEGDAAKSIYYIDGTRDKSAIKNAKKTTIAPFRAYFNGPSIDELTANGTHEAKAVRLVIEEEDGTTTVIQSPIEAEGYKLKAKGTFNLAGQKVDENYRGIVIKNGKKYLIK